MSSIAQALPIDEVEVGSRVEVTAEAEALCSHEAREGQVRVSFVFNDERLTWDTNYLTRLMPRAEAESLGYEVGGSAWIDGAEFGSTGWAEIASIDSVEVPAGEGCVVHATNVHSNGDMVRLYLSDASEVFVTGGHRFWSVSRGDWFAARELRVGEVLRTPAGVVHVDGASVEAVVTPVFNLEVEGAHEFFVGDAEVLAHNGKDSYVVGEAPSGARGRTMTRAEHRAQQQAAPTDAERYAALVNTNEMNWDWNTHFPGASSGRQSRIRRQARADGLIPDVPLVPGTNYRDFDAAGQVIRTERLPPRLWSEQDGPQFDWLNKRLPGGVQPPGTTWHHSHVRGRMELVPYGIHRAYSHDGGRTVWAAPRPRRPSRPRGR